MSKSKSIILWIMSFVLMAGLAIYQRMTGPTYPKTGNIEISGSQIKYKLPTSDDGDGRELIKIKVPDNNITGEISYKRFKSNDEWWTSKMKRSGDELIGNIPGQPPAGKVMYNINLFAGGMKHKLTEEPVIIRFKGFVPRSILYPHIFFMFLGMVFSMRGGLEALFKGAEMYKLAVWTSVAIVAGGLVLGPIVQYYAFGALWTGWPFGHDLTDNKTIAGVIFWIISVIRLKKHPNEWGWPVAAAVILLAVYLVPHSVLGSEIDYTKLPK